MEHVDTIHIIWLELARIYVKTQHILTVWGQILDFGDMTIPAVTI